jgi:hypothetical protein
METSDMPRHGKATESLNDTLVRSVKIVLPEAAANDDGAAGEAAVVPAWDPLEVWRRCVRDVRDSREDEIPGT